MIAWIIAALSNPLVRKVTFYVVGIAVILYGLRFYGNRQWAKGEAQGRQQVAHELVKQKQAEWKAKEAAIAADAAVIIEEKRAVAAATEQLRQDRAQLSRSLNSALATVAGAKERDYENAAAVSPAQLDSAIRSISAELAAAH